MDPSTALVKLIFNLATFQSLCGLLSFVNQLYLLRRKQILVRFLIKSNIGFGPTMRIKLTNRQHHRNRRFWIRPGRSNAWWSNFLAQKVINGEWKENFRLSRENFIGFAMNCDLSLSKPGPNFAIL